MLCIGVMRDAAEAKTLPFHYWFDWAVELENLFLVPMAPR